MTQKNAKPHENLGSQIKSSLDPRLIKAIFAYVEAYGVKTLGQNDVYHQVLSCGPLMCLEIDQATFEAFYPDQVTLLDAVFRYIDLELLDVIRDEFESFGEFDEKERLFEVLMRRFELSQPFKRALAKIHHEITINPRFALERRRAGLSSVQLMLNLARVQLTDQAQISQVQLHLLSLVYLKLVGVWLRDESLELSHTMAAIDRFVDRYILKILHPEKITLDVIYRVLHDMR